MRDNWLSQWAVCQSLTHAADTKGLLRKECGAGHRWFIRHPLLSWLPDSEETNVTQILIIASRINTVREWGGKGGQLKADFKASTKEVISPYLSVGMEEALW